MGAKTGPSNPNHFVSYSKEENFNQYIRLNPNSFGRYRLVAVSCTKEELDLFVHFVTHFNTDLKVTWEVSKSSVTIIVHKHSKIFPLITHFLTVSSQIAQLKG